jgi:hypothetical protein
VELLEHVAQRAAPNVHQFVFGKAVHAPAVDGQRAGRRRVQRGEQVDERRLARAGGAEHAHRLAGADVDVHAVERLDGLAASLVMPFQPASGDDGFVVHNVPCSLSLTESAEDTENNV